MLSDTESNFFRLTHKVPNKIVADDNLLLFFVQ